MTNSLHSPKNKFRIEIHFNKPSKDTGSVISYTANSVEQLKSYAEMYKNAHVVIKQNLKEFPKFEWVNIESYNI